MSRRTPAAAASGLAALLALLGVIVGLPMLLVAVAADPVPDRLPTLQQIGEALSRPDDGTLFLGLLTVVAWVGWAWFTGSVVLDLFRRATRRGQASRLELPVGRLVGAALVLLVAAPTAASAVGPSSAAAAAEEAHIPAAAASEPATDGGAEVVVEPGDTLWAISDEHLGDPYRYVEIFDENRGAVQLDGRVLTDPDLIRPGWRFALPDSEPAAEPAAEGGVEGPRPAPTAPGDAGAGMPPTADPEADEEVGPVVTPLRPRMLGGAGTDAGKPPAAEPEVDSAGASVVTPLRVVPTSYSNAGVAAVRPAATPAAAAEDSAVMTPLRAAESAEPSDLRPAPPAVADDAAAGHPTDPTGWRVSRAEMLRAGIDPAELASALGVPDVTDEAWSAALARNDGGEPGQDWRERIADLFTDTR